MTTDKLPIVMARVITHYDPDQVKYIKDHRMVEVLSINLNERTMHVRYKTSMYPHMGEPQSIRTDHVKFENVSTARDLGEAIRELLVEDL